MHAAMFSRHPAVTQGPVAHEDHARIGKEVVEHAWDGYDIDLVVEDEALVAIALHGGRR